MTTHTGASRPLAALYRRVRGTRPTPIWFGIVCALSDKQMVLYIRTKLRALRP